MAEAADAERRDFWDAMELAFVLEFRVWVSFLLLPVSSFARWSACRGERYLCSEASETAFAFLLWI